MSKQLELSVGQYSDKGRKNINQDFHGFYAPNEPLLTSKGIAIAIADGISSSDVSHIASETSVRSFLDDYFCTSEAWSVEKSAQQILAANNAWLYSQSQKSPQRFDKDKGYVCTLSAIVFKSSTAHIFHIGDARIYRLRVNSTDKSHVAKNSKQHEEKNVGLEQLTIDHRVWISQEQSYLSRALGIEPQVEVNYSALPLQVDDIFILMTDGVYEHIDATFIINAINTHAAHLNNAVQAMVEQAYAQGSSDNLTAQIVRIDALGIHNTQQHYQQLTALPFAPILETQMLFDDYTIVRELHASSRSHVYLAHDNNAPDKLLIIKTPSIDLQSDAAYLERFFMEEWIARRIKNPHVLKAYNPTRQRNFLYLTTEYIDGQTLAQWMNDNPQPDVETVRTIVEQIAKGLRAFHRLEMLHQDLRPANIMIDRTGVVKIIDFGSTRVAGMMEIATHNERNHLLGTAQYTAPEYFLGEAGTVRSDMFSLGVIAYQMLCGKLPYGTAVAKARTKAAQHKLSYRSVLDDEREIPAWIDYALKKVLDPNPYGRYEELSEFIYDLRHPTQTFLNKERPPLLERNPVMFWQGITLVLLLIIIILLNR